MLDRFTLLLLTETFAVCKLDKEAAIPNWVGSSGFISVTRTTDELSIVCPQLNVPVATVCERGWRCMRIDGTLAFSMIGVVASLASTLAQEGVSIFVISTYNTDYFLTKDKDLARASNALTAAGHQLRLPE
jgi:uncharacterized protein